MTPKQILNSELTDAEKISAIKDYAKQDALAFNLFVNKYGVRQDALYSLYLLDKAKKEAANENAG